MSPKVKGVLVALLIAAALIVIGFNVPEEAGRHFGI